MSCSKKCPYTDKHCVHSLPICKAYEKEYKPLTAIRCKIEVSNNARENTHHTNAERIRSMSDEELAEFMANKGGYIACSQCDFFNRDEGKCESPSGWLCAKGYAEALIQKWLQSEVK